MKRYTQLICIERYQISTLNKAGLPQTEIATVIGMHKSTISRELPRNTGVSLYRHLRCRKIEENVMAAMSAVGVSQTKSAFMNGSYLWMSGHGSVIGSAIPLLTLIS